MVSRGLLALLAAWALAGCFDVHAVDLLVIDDFESGDLLPTDPGFGKWDDYPINTVDDGNIIIGLDSNDTQDHSKDSLVLNAIVVDPPNGFQEHGGAAVQTKATMGAVDFTHYDRIRFDIELKSGDRYPLSSSALVYLELGCSTVAPESGATRNDLYVSQGVSYQAYWQSTSLTLVNFGPPQWLATPIEGGRDGCLRAVDSIRFSIDAQVPDGMTGQGIMHIDNVVLLKQ